MLWPCTIRMNEYSKYSFWLETAGEALVPRPALPHSIEVDVAVLGGGYTGLWTAYYLLRDNPALRVAILEKEIVGFGASGRNGGWCSSKFPVTPAMLEHRYGRDAARELMLAMNAAVDEIARFCEREQVDAHFHKGGLITLARGAHQLPTIQASFAAYERLGLGNQYRLLNSQQATELVRVTKTHGALYATENASVHPARLVRGLARAVERYGGVIYEHTDVIDFTGGDVPCCLTPAGEVRAKKAVVLVGEAYLTRLRKLHRALLPVYSLIALTEPLTETQWSEVGWRNRESIASARNTVDYLTQTSDGRILFGSRGAPYRYGSKITDEQDRHKETHDRIERAVVEWFPMLAGIKFTHWWGGPVGMPRDWMPIVDFDLATRIATARGYTGQGVSTTNLTGRILAGLIAEKRTGFEALPLVRRKSPNWEPEPFRWLAVRYMQDALLRIDTAQEDGCRTPWDTSLVERLARH